MISAQELKKISNENILKTIENNINRLALRGECLFSLFNIELTEDQIKYLDSLGYKINIVSENYYQISW